MLRPATPLAVMLFAAFVLLLLSVLSTPLIKGIPLGSFQGVNFGVFGFCKPDGTCSSIELGYDTSSLFSAADSNTFDLPTSTRATLSNILVLHPVAAFLTLVMLIMAFAAHFHSASHSVRYLLVIFIISIFTFLAALLAFLIDVLLFVPHMAWGSFIVLAAACLVGLSSIVSCAMRRTLVSRKSRQRRIAANAEMSGENFYNRQAQETAAVATANGSSMVTGSQASAPRQPTLPRLGGPSSNGGSFEKKDDGSSDEQIPLTSQTQQIANRYSQQPPPRNQDAMMMSGAAGSVPPQRPNRPPSVQRDQYGNPLPYGNSMSPPPPDGYGMRRNSSFDRMNNMSPSQRGRGGGPGYRGGRPGGPSPGPYGPPGRGGYGPPPLGRGGYGPPPGRGGYGGPMPPPNGRGRGYGGRGGYPGPGRGRTPPPGYRYDQPGPYGGGMRGPSPGPTSAPGAYYANGSAPNLQGSIGSGGGGGEGYESYRPDRTVSSELPRAESPPPLPGMESGSPGGNPSGQAIEMDATAARPQPPQQLGRFGEADEDIAGMVGLQQGRTSGAIPEHESETHDGQYVPVRAGWNAQDGRARTPARGAAELGVIDGADDRRPTTSEAYIEDVDPRFAEPQNNKNSSFPTHQQQQQQHALPALTVPSATSYEDIPQGARSPAESERSTFTSISQRGINPRWNPPPPALMPGYGGAPGMGPGQLIPRRPVRDPNETLLSSNPDFSLPTAGRRPPGGPGGGSNVGGGSAGGMIPGSAYPAL